MCVSISKIDVQLYIVLNYIQLWILKIFFTLFNVYLYITLTKIYFKIVHDSFEKFYGDTVWKHLVYTVGLNRGLKVL